MKQPGQAIYEPLLLSAWQGSMLSYQSKTSHKKKLENQTS